ncbi:hypothetical protein [Streptomyces mirabilis]|uniref:Uncharacterized protein n=1 Tax=Streptomyces mirabilis TaxID=68239 RepID=A0ABU3UR04_9ACTN|nr:hypothetical protein [Streptomyces mirabilis]MCX4610168.1 hypothetical protein [Streptomyces mirabilis]MDU8996155.1 hypothetical protein [Streptomyces mirabilis]
MSTPPHPPLEGQQAATTGPQDAERATPELAVGEPKGVAEGVPTAVRPDPQQGDGRFPVAWLHICAPRGAVPTATSKCLCGRDRSAVGRARVLLLIEDHTAHRNACPFRTPLEGRTAA